MSSPSLQIWLFLGFPHWKCNKRNLCFSINSILTSNRSLLLEILLHILKNFEEVFRVNSYLLINLIHTLNQNNLKLSYDVFLRLQNEDLFFRVNEDPSCFSSNSCINFLSKMLSSGSQVFSSEPYPFHFTRYCNRPERMRFCFTASAGKQS